MSKTQFRIVIVEDSEPDVFLVREALQGSGVEYELHVLDDGEKAVGFLDQVDRGEGVPRPHLILLDLNLPKRSGAQVLERVRQSTACGGVPVVILTSSDSPKDRALAAELKATKYFRKPSRLDEFMTLGPLVRDLLLGCQEAQPTATSGA
jgi:chemotaxis family two-component system response regulator Rcp1